jgi:hypothetical protein
MNTKFLHCQILLLAASLLFAASARAQDIELHGTIAPENLGTHIMLPFQGPPGIERMTVTLISPGFQKGMYLTAGLFDPQRYRGEGRQSFTVSSVDATGPYLAGPSRLCQRSLSTCHTRRHQGRARLHQVNGPDGPDLHLSAGAAVMGDEISAPSGQKLNFTLTAKNAGDTTPRIFLDGKPEPSAINTFTSDGRRHWVLAELDDPSGQPVTITNPIYVNWR